MTFKLADNEQFYVIPLTKTFTVSAKGGGRDVVARQGPVKSLCGQIELAGGRVIHPREALQHIKSEIIKEAENGSIMKKLANRFRAEVFARTAMMGNTSQILYAAAEPMHEQAVDDVVQRNIRGGIVKNFHKPVSSAL